MREIIEDLSIETEDLDSDADGVVDIEDAFPYDETRFRPAVSTLTLADGTIVLQLEGALEAETNGGDSIRERRTIYFNASDTNQTPIYRGSEWPYVTVAYLPELPAELGVTHSVVDGIYTINGLPVYQYANETSSETADGTVVNWRIVGVKWNWYMGRSANDGIDSSDGDAYDLGRDKFATDPAASLDFDGDGYPDAWDEGMSQEDSTTGLMLDMAPYDPSLAVDASSIIPEFENEDRKVGLVGWYTASNETLMFDGDKVKRWSDITGNNNHFDQEDSNSMPSLNTDTMGLIFDRNSSLEVAMAKPTNNTIFIVAKGTGELFGDSSTYIIPRVGGVIFGTGEDRSEYETFENNNINGVDKNIFIIRDNFETNEIEFRVGMDVMIKRELTVGKKGKRHINVYWISRS